MSIVTARHRHPTVALGARRAIRASLAAIVWLVWTVTAAHAATIPYPLPPAARALFVYPTATELADPTATWRTTLVARAVANHITDLYVSVYAPTDTHLFDQGGIAALVAAAHAAGQRVWADYGDPDWPTLGCGTAAWPQARMADIAGYNHTHPDAAFDGVLLDVEPATDVAQAGLVSLYTCLRDTLRADGLKTGVAVSPYLPPDILQATMGLGLDAVVLMGYWTTAGSPPCASGDACIDAAALADAADAGMSARTLIGLETAACEPAAAGAGATCSANNTFHSGGGQTSLDAVATALATGIGALAAGFAIDAYEGSYLSGTSDWPATDSGFPTYMAAAPPAGTTVAGAGIYYLAGTPHISAGEPLVISTSRCDSGAMTARYTVTPTGGGTPVEGDLLPQADGSITITAAIATVGVAPGRAIVALTVTCGALPARAVAFDLYIDPSGAVLDQEGQPVAGATVRLLRADSAAGPFTEIASDATARDAHLDPGTPNAPETTGSDGAYSWNVTQGYYRVEAFAAGYACPTPAPIGFACVVDGDGRSGIASAPLAIPPAVVGLTLHLTRQDTACTGAPCPGDPAATPELGSGDLLAIGLLPFGVALYRRRRTRRATQQ